jgi:hypothetical protein
MTPGFRLLGIGPRAADADGPEANRRESPARARFLFRLFI